MVSHPEGAWVNPRTPRTDKRIPADEVSSEDVAPDFYSDRPKTPEEELIAKEDGTHPDIVETDSWTEWVQQQFMERAAAVRENQDAEDDLSWREKRRLEEEYWTAIEALAKAYDTLDERHESLAQLIERFHLPSRVQMSKETVEHMRSKAAFYRSHGPRGKEPRGKHQRGPTIRKPENLEN